MKVYFEQINGEHRSSKIFDYPRESNTLDYLIRQEVRNICGEGFGEDAVIEEMRDTVKGDLLVQFRTFYWS